MNDILVDRNLRWSWTPTLVVMAATLLSYIDRNTLAVLSPTILKDLQLNAQEYGLIVSAFSLAYLIGNPGWGVILDRVGSKKGFGIAVALWSLISGCHALVGGFLGMFTVRAGLGLAEGATFPGALKTVSETLPADRSSRGIAIAISGGSLGAVITPLIVTPIALHWGWRSAFFVTGGLGAIWVLAWIAIRKKGASTAEAAITSPRAIKLDYRLGAYVSSYALGAFPLAFGLYAAPLYFSKVLLLSQQTIGHLLWIPPAGWEIGYLVWGWAADTFLRDPSKLTKWLIILVGLGAPLAALPLTRSTYAVIALLFLCMFAAAGFVVLSLRFGIHIYSSGRAALVTGIGAGAWSAVVAVVMPYIGRLFDQARFTTACVLTALLPCLGTCLWFVLCRRGARREQLVAH